MCTSLEEKLARIRFEIAMNPRIRVDETIGRDGRIFETFADVELVGSFIKEGKIKILGRMSNVLTNRSMIDDGYDLIEEKVREGILKRICDISDVEIELVLRDLDDVPDFDDW